MITGDIKKFNDAAIDKMHFFLESGFWSKPNFPDFNRWLNNFSSDEELYCALKLLNRFVYYSEEDIIRLLDYGLNEVIFNRYLLKKELETDFRISNKNLTKIKDEFISKVKFIPLKTGNLSESSTVISRYLTNEFGIDESNILNIEKIKKKDLEGVKNLVIIDDFIGTGTQIFNFWNNSIIELDDVKMEVKKLQNMFQDITFEYFCLVSTDDGLTDFHLKNLESNTSLRVTYGEKLSDSFKVFGANSMYFEDLEIDQCRSVLDELTKRKGISLYGYEQNDYAIAFHHSIPDCSLPLFFKETANWNSLFKNKKTKSESYVR